ncbi:MAG: hypothetical protein WAO69_00295 [Aestuariivita sp.]|uniref:spike base protein, RCAP_Rcc01079 family n=1 Tax=Aestuariivita sp. TaxID=1872407 RepID=UPI003BAF60A2
MPISDKFDTHQTGLNSPIQGGFDITPDDSGELAEVTRALMVTTSGDVAVELRNGDLLTLPGLMPGAIYPLRIQRVFATGTTATGLKGLV